MTTTKAKIIFPETDRDIVECWLEDHKTWNPTSTLKIYELKNTECKHTGRLEAGGFAVATSAGIIFEDKNYKGINSFK